MDQRPRPGTSRTPVNMIVSAALTQIIKRNMYASTEAITLFDLCRTANKQTGYNLWIEDLYALAQTFCKTKIVLYVWASCPHSKQRFTSLKRDFSKCLLKHIQKKVTQSIWDKINSIC